MLNGKKRLFILLLSCLSVGISLSYAFYPWDDYGMFQHGYHYKDTDTRFPYLTGSFIEYFEEKYGIFPKFIIWEDTNQPARINLSFHYDRPRKAPTPEWGEKLMYGDVRPYLFWRIESVKNGTVSYLPLTLSLTDTVNLVWEYGWLIDNVILDLRDLPIPNDGSAYYFQIVVFEDAPIEGEEVFRSEEPWSIIRSKRNTPYDSLAWAYYGEELEWNKDVAVALLEHFPTSRAILRRLVNIYASDNNCDSLRWAARQFKKALEPGADPMAVPVEGFEGMTIAGAESSRSFIPTPKYINQLLTRVCGDTLLE